MVEQQQQQPSATMICFHLVDWEYMVITWTNNKQETIQLLDDRMA